MKRSPVVFVLIALLGCFWAGWVNVQNIRFMQSSGQIVYQGMVGTADDASYLAPAVNYKRTGVWKDNSTGLSSYIQRPPGMGMLNVLLYTLVPRHAYEAHKWVALFLHFMALLLFADLVKRSMGYITAVVLQLVYAILPCFWGYVFYHLTESITPSLLVFLLYGYVRYAQKPGVGWLVYQSAWVGVLLLVRPQLAFFILPYAYFWWKYVRMFSLRRWTFLTCMVLAFGGFAGWQMRNASISRKLQAENWAGIHPIYSRTNTSQYRPVHQSLGALFKIWEPNSENFHTVATALFEQGISEEGADTQQVIRVLEKVNAHHCEGIDNNRLKDIFLRYESILHENRYAYTSHQPILKETPAEENFRQEVDALTRELKKKNRWLCYVKTPVRSAVFMFTKSQLNLALFQVKYRGCWWMELLRYFCVAGIACMSLLMLGNLVTKNRWMFFIALGYAAYLAYLFFVQKMNEERYLLPWLPVILFGGYYRLHTWINRSGQKLIP